MLFAMDWFRVFETQLPEGATKGIAFSGIAIVGAAIVFVLIRVSTYLKTSGALQVELHPMMNLGISDIRLTVKFFNSSRKDFKFGHFAIYTKASKGYVEAARLCEAPVETGGHNARWDYEASTLNIPGGGSYLGIFLFAAPSLPKGTYYLGYQDDKGKMFYHPFTR